MRVIRFVDETGATRYGEEAAVGATTSVLEGELFANSRPIVFAGPSGAGKGTMIEKLMKKYDGAFGFSVSHTTRGPRSGEVNGVHYHFTTREAMQAEIDEGKFIEHADVHGKFYGTSSKSVQDVASAGKVGILDIDIQGVKSVKASHLDPLYIFIEPPSMAVLEQRLRGRGTEKEEAIQKRLANAQGEMDYGAKKAGNFDFNLVNDELEGAFGRLEAWLRAQYPEVANYPLPCNGLRASGAKATVKQILAPLAPCNIFCIGLNYRAHAAECGAAVPERPVVFMKPTSAACGPGDAIQVPNVAKGWHTDYEVELAVVIGRPCKDATEAEALSYVAGYTVANDVSSRYWQMNAGGGQWIKGKAFDTHCPLGPTLLCDGSLDPQNLRVATRLNGKTMQDSNSSDMIFTVAQCIAWLSKDQTLLPGTVIITGTPQGVGIGHTPPIWLKDGDVVEVEVEKIGTLSNPVVGPANPEPEEEAPDKSASAVATAAAPQLTGLLLSCAFAVVAIVAAKKLM